jgi:2'-hydroxyisoflavone reductase
MAELLQACHQVAGSDAHFVWCDDAELLCSKAEPWSGLPLWIPESDPDFGGMLLASNQRAMQAGLRTRPWVETARDTLAWARAAGSVVGSAATLTAEAEAEILAALPQIQQ